jgi:hypothetical protein
MGRHLEGVDFNHFGKVVLIELDPEDGPVGTRSTGKGEKFTEKGFLG